MPWRWFWWRCWPARAGPAGRLAWAAGFHLAGILLFSGSLYLLVLAGQPWLGPVTPLGGLCFMIGWALLAAARPGPSVHTLTKEIPRMMQVIVNGDPLALPAGSTVTALIEHLGLAGRRVAVEVNEDIVPRSRHDEVTLQAGDRIEVVHAIGGG